MVPPNLLALQVDPRNKFIQTLINEKRRKKHYFNRAFNQLVQTTCNISLGKAAAAANHLQNASFNRNFTVYYRRYCGWASNEETIGRCYCAGEIIAWGLVHCNSSSRCHVYESRRIQPILLHAHARIVYMRAQYHASFGVEPIHAGASIDVLCNQPTSIIIRAEIIYRTCKYGNKLSRCLLLSFRYIYTFMYTSILRSVLCERIFPSNCESEYS